MYEQAHADAGGGVLRQVGRELTPTALGPGGARDVEVDPGPLVYEVREEPGRGDRAGRSAAGVLDVADAALDQLVVLRPEWQPPDALAGRLAGAAHHVGDRVVVGEQPAGVVAERHDAGAGQGGQVDDGIRFLLD